MMQQAGWRIIRFATVVLVSGVLLAASGAAVAQQPAEGKLSAEALVIQLGDFSYHKRERAREELARRGAAVREALEAGRQSSDLEVRYHCERLLVEIEEQALLSRLEAFVSDAGNDIDYNLPGWSVMRKAVGDNEAIRELYVEMLQEERYILEALDKLEQGGDALATHVNARSQALIRRTPGAAFTPPTVGNIAALLLAAAQENVSVSRTTQSYIYSLCHQQVFKAAMATNRSEALRELVLDFAKTIPDENGTLAMNLLMNNNLTDECLELAVRLIGSKTATHHVKQYAVLNIAKVGNEKHIPALEALLDDTSLCTTRTVNKIRFTTQLRDVALYAMIHLSKEDPKQFGFVNITGQTPVASSSMLGFVSDEERESALARWREHAGKKEESVSAAAEEADQ